MSDQPDDDALDGQVDTAFERLLEYLRDGRAFDFTGYKRASLMRRVRHQMARVDIAGFDAYTDYLQVHPAEFTELFNTILINVTGFFRDREAWQLLQHEIVPQLLSNSATAPIRVWSAGCATGQEAYSLAMVLAEALGPERFRQQVKIYATDVDEDALSYARLASYPESDLAELPPGYAERYFEANDDRRQFRSDLRRSVIFGRNDLIQDAPISRIDLLLCRNTLMYFNSEAQQRIINRLAFALQPQGVLFLGRAEMLLNHASYFEPVDLKRRFFRKRTAEPASVSTPVTARQHDDPAAAANPIAQLTAEAFGAGSAASLVVDNSGRLRLANAAARVAFSLSAPDLGRPFQDLEISYRPAELRSPLEEARRTRQPVSVRAVRWHRSARELAILDITLTPLVDGGGRLLGVAVDFADVSRQHELASELDLAHRKLETAREELQSTNEELETTNEELQSTVEELETTNEELQSTNEELETTNEELQSMNDELHATNVALGERTSQIMVLNEFTESVLSNLSAAVIVLSPDLAVRVWNRQAEELWGLREAETLRQHFLNLDSGLPTEVLRPLIREVLAGVTDRAEVSVAAVNRRGREVTVRVLITALTTANSDDGGALLLMEVVR